MGSTGTGSTGTESAGIGPAGDGSPWSRFRARVERRGEHRVWTGARTATGTGVVRIGGRLRTVQRAAWEFANGPLPTGARVRACPEEKACVRIGHLRLARPPDTGGGFDSDFDSAPGGGAEVWALPLPAAATPADPGPVSAGPAGSGVLARRQRTRLALTRAAVVLFRERGCEATTVEEIAEAAACSRRTFFRHFRSKEDVMFGDASERLRGIRAELAGARHSPDPVATARQALRTHFLGFGLHSDPELEAECIASWMREPALHRRYAELVLEWEGAVREYLARCWRVDAENDVRCQVVGIALAGVVRAALTAQVAPGGDVEQVIDDGFALLDRGFADLG
jgi:AcrR family transcriptional regulator